MGTLNYKLITTDIVKLKLIDNIYILVNFQNLRE